MNRFRVPEDETAEFRPALEAALQVLSGRKGYAGGNLGRNVDDPTLWTMVTQWDDVGSYRRALSSYEVKLGAVPPAERARSTSRWRTPLVGELNRGLPRGSA